MDLLPIHLLSALLYSPRTDRIYSYACFPPKSISVSQLALRQVRLFNYNTALFYLLKFWKVQLKVQQPGLCCSTMEFIPYYKPAGWKQSSHSFAPSIIWHRNMKWFHFWRHVHRCTLCHLPSLMHMELSLPIIIWSSDLWSSRLKMQPSAPAYVLLCDIAAFVNSERHMVWLCIWILREASGAI